MRTLSKGMVWVPPLRFYIFLQCWTPAPCRESFHCILAGKLCPTALSPLPSVPARETDTARASKTERLFSQAACGGLDEEVSCHWGLKTQSGMWIIPHLRICTCLWSGPEKTDLTGLDVLQRWEEKMGAAGQERLRTLRDGESIRRKESIFSFSLVRKWTCQQE